jgi:hypothetical protein
VRRGKTRAQDIHQQNLRSPFETLLAFDTQTVVAPPALGVCVCQRDSPPACADLKCSSVNFTDLVALFTMCKNETDGSVTNPKVGTSLPKTFSARHPMEYGGGGRVRTDDLRLAKPLLSQLSYAPGKRMVGLARLELATLRLSGVRSNHLSYRPETRKIAAHRGIAEASADRRDALRVTARRPARP